MSTMFKPVLFVLCLVMAACGQAGARSAQLTEARVSEVTGPLSVSLITEGGEVEIRLASLMTPVPERTQTYLDTLLADRVVDVEFLSDTADRYQRRIGTIWLRDGLQRVDLHERLLEAGLVQVYPYPDAIARLSRWLAVEDAARSGAAGLWGEYETRLRDVDPDVLIQDLGTIQVVEGRVTDVAVLASGRVYLNFGSDYRTDFTVRLEAESAPDFADHLGELSALHQRRIRVRGVIRDENGPMIIPSNPLRLEVLDD